MSIFSSGFLLHFQAWPSVGLLLPPVLTSIPLDSFRRIDRKARKQPQPIKSTLHENELDVNDSMMALTVFKCKLCSKNFKKREYLRDHLNIHAGRKCYACNYCGESFVHRASMARHRLKCHLSPTNQLPTEGAEEIDILL